MASVDIPLQVQDSERLIERHAPGGRSRRPDHMRSGTIAPVPFHSRIWTPWVLFLADAVTVQLIVASAWFVWSQVDRTLLSEQSLGAFCSLAIRVSMINFVGALMGIYSISRIGPVDRLRRRIFVLLCSFLVVGAWAVIGPLHWPPIVLIASAGLCTLLCPLVDELTRSALMRWNYYGEPAVIIGNADNLDALVLTLRGNRASGLVPIAICNDDPATHGKMIAGVPVIGPVSHAKKLTSFARIALVAPSDSGSGPLVRMSERLPFPRVILFPNLDGMASLSVNSRDLGGLLAIEVHKQLRVRYHWRVKRTIDVVAGIPLILMTAPIILIASILIRLRSGATPIYRQERIGLGGKRFEVIKLRTMYPDADQRLEQYLKENPAANAEWNQFFKLRDDPRILPGIGHFLRRTSLDELPQLLNVLRGEMSLVGPRPFPCYHLNSFPLDFRAMRRGVRPGLTGLWQVSGRSNGDLTVQENMDRYYVRNWSVWLDFHILLRTVWVVLAGRGAR